VGFSSSTSQLNLSRFCHLNQPMHPQKVFTLSRKVDTCSALAIRKDISHSGIFRARSTVFAGQCERCRHFSTARQTSAQPAPLVSVPDLLTTRCASPRGHKNTSEPQTFVATSDPAQMFSRLVGLRGRRSAGKSGLGSYPLLTHAAHVRGRRRIANKAPRAMRRRSYRTRRRDARRRRGARGRQTVISRNHEA